MTSAQLHYSQKKQYIKTSGSSTPHVFEVSSPSAAGIPVLEIIRRLEEEKVIRKEDRLPINQALNNPSRHDKILKALKKKKKKMNKKKKKKSA